METYKLIEFRPAVPFQTVGFLAKIAETIANEGMNILIVSTFSKDYIMIKEEFMRKRFILALKNVGFPIEYEKLLIMNMKILHKSYNF